jgi:hypothetical protein
MLLHYYSKIYVYLERNKSLSFQNNNLHIYISIYNQILQKFLIQTNILTVR